MPEHSAENRALPPWRVPVAVEDVAETGERFDLEADAATRAAVARVAGLRDLPRLEATFELKRRGEGLHVCGRVSATVGQACVVTLEALANEVEEDIDVVFVPPAAPAPESEEIGDDSRAEAEPLIGGVVDLGALATEFLILGIDPYPRKPGAMFEPPPDAKPDQGPFAALAELKKDRDGR